MWAALFLGELGAPRIRALSPHNSFKSPHFSHVNCFTASMTPTSPPLHHLLSEPTGPPQATSWSLKNRKQAQLWILLTGKQKLGHPHSHPCCSMKRSPWLNLMELDEYISGLAKDLFFCYEAGVRMEPFLRITNGASEEGKGKSSKGVIKGHWELQALSRAPAPTPGQAGM